MTTLPTGFEDWPEDAQEHFLSEARSRSEIMQMVIEELDIELKSEVPSGNGYINKEALIELFQRVNDE